MDLRQERAEEVARVQGGAVHLPNGKWQATCVVVVFPEDGSPGDAGVPTSIPHLFREFNSYEEARDAGAEAGISWFENSYPHRQLS